MLFTKEFNPTKEELEEGCKEDLHPMALKGIDLFNEGKYWLAHEALEEAWKEETGTVRNLYQGVLQAGVIYLQIERENFIGALKMYERCKNWLWPWPKECRGLAIGILKSDIDAAVNEVKRLGIDRIGEFDKSLFKELDSSLD